MADWGGTAFTRRLKVSSILTPSTKNIDFEPVLVYIYNVYWGSKMKCEKCSKTHNGEYGSGRFCFNKCARSFSTKNKRKEINSKVSKTLSGRTGMPSPLKGKKRPEEVGKKIAKCWANKRLLHRKTLNFEDLTSSERREEIIEDQNRVCNICGIKEEWNGKPLKFELDHISGDKTNNSRENLRLICSNCHQQTPTYKGRNNSQAKRINDEQAITALLESRSGFECLKKLGMNMHGKNYEKLRKVIKTYNIKIGYIV